MYNVAYLTVERGLVWDLRLYSLLPVVVSPLHNFILPMPVVVSPFA